MYRKQGSCLNSFFLLLTFPFRNLFLLLIQQVSNELSLECLVVNILSYSKKGKLAKMMAHCHSFSLVVARCLSLPLVAPLAVTRCHLLYHSLPFVDTYFHALSPAVPLVVTRCHQLSLNVPLVCLFINNLSQAQYKD